MVWRRSLPGKGWWWLRLGGGRQGWMCVSWAKCSPLGRKQMVGHLQKDLAQEGRQKGWDDPNREPTRSQRRGQGKSAASQRRPGLKGDSKVKSSELRATMDPKEEQAFKYTAHRGPWCWISMTTFPVSFNSPKFPLLYPILTLGSKTPPGRGGGVVRMERRKWLSEMEEEKNSHWMSVQNLNIGQNWFLISEIDKKKNLTIGSSWDSTQEAVKNIQVLRVSGDKGKVVVFWLDCDAQFIQLYILTQKALFCIYNDIQKKKKADWCYMIPK